MATITSTTSGNWNATGTWAGGAVPHDTNDDVVIDNGHTVTLTGADSCKSLTVNTGGIYDGDGNILTVAGESSAGWAIRFNNGQISGTDSDFTITYNGTASIDLNCASGNPRHLVINHADADIKMETGAITLLGNLTITAGELDTDDDVALTVTGATTINGGSAGNEVSRLNLNGSTAILGSGITSAPGVLVQNGGGFYADADSTVTMGSLDVNYDGSNEVRLLGTNVINSYSDSNRIVKLTSGVIDASGTSLTITTATTGKTISCFDDQFGNLTLTPASSTTYNMVSSGINIGGNLTINANATLDTTGSNYPLTVAGELWCVGTFTSNSSAVIARNVLITGGTFNAPDGSGSLTITGEGNSGSGDGYAFRRVAGAFVDNSGTVTFTTATETQIRMGTAAQDFYNVIIDESSAGGLFYVNDEGFTVTNDLTLTDGDFDTGLGTTAPLIDIQGDLIIGDNNTFGGITATQTSDISFGSITINGTGATYKATSGTTTITSTGATGDAAKSWQNLRGDNGFEHNNGKVKFTSTSDAEIKENKFYDFEMNGNAAGRNYSIRDISGNAINIYGDLTVTQGRLTSSTTSDAITVHGNTHVAANGTLWYDSDQDTGKIIHHGLVTNLGEMRINDGTTIKLNGGIRQLNTLTIA